jgi:RNA polymerase sigma factor (sigma-70 family)
LAHREEVAEKEPLNAAMARFARGDRSAAPAVFDELWPRSLTFCTRALGRPHGEDAAQRAMMKLFEQASDFDPSKDALAWAYEFSLWECRRELTSRSRSREAGWSPAEVGRVVGMQPNPEERLETEELKAALNEALAQLRPADRETLLAVIQDAPSAVAQATWRKRKERAIGRLKAMWRMLHGND